MSSRRVERDRATGDWVVRVPPEDDGYSTVSQPGVRKRIPISRYAPREDAEARARSLGMLDEKGDGNGRF